MADIEGYKKFKERSKAGPSLSGYEAYKASVAAPLPTPARPSPVGRALDFTRRAFMGEPEVERNNPLQNALRDASDIITGTSHLLGQTAVGAASLVKDAAKSNVPLLKTILGVQRPKDAIAEFMTSPLVERAKAMPRDIKEITSPEGKEMMKEDFAKPAIESFKKSFTTPVDSFSNHPLFTIIDWSTLLDVAGGAVRAGLNVSSKAAKIAGKAGTAAKLADITSTTREALNVAPRGEVARTFSKNPLIKYGVQKPLDKIAANPQLQEFMSNNSVMKYIAPDAFITPEARAGRVAEKTATATQGEFYRMRNQRMDEAMKIFNQIPKNERETFVAVVQGRATPRYMSPEFKKAYDWYKNVVADEQSKFALKDETVKRVAYQPLAVSRGLLSPEDYKLAMRGDEAAIAKVRTVTDDLAEARVRVQEDAIKEWMGTNIKMDKRTRGFKAMAKELAEEMTPDPLYFPSVFAEKVKLADFLPTKFLQRFKPGFMKGRTGAFGFIEKEPEAAFAIHQSQVERYLQNESLITAIKDKFALPLKKASDLKEGYKVFAPDGYIGFYKGSMPLQEAFLRGAGMGQDLDAAFAGAMQKVLPELVQDKSFIGVRRPTLYQVPADVAKKLQDAIAPTTAFPEPFKLLWDKPLQAFKFSVLAMSPRWIVNNTVGNMVTSMLGRVSPESFVKAMDPDYAKMIPGEVTAGGFRRTEVPSLKKVLTPSSGMADKVTGFFTGKLPTEGALKDVQGVVSAPVKVAGKFADTVFEVNAKVEDAFRNAAFIDKTTKAAVEEISKKTAGGIIDMKTGLDKFLQKGDFAKSNVIKVAEQMLNNPTFKEQMIGKVNSIMNDYNALSKFERSIVRRVVPFWSWWKFVNIMFWTMPVKDPAMAQIIKQLGTAGQEISKQEWQDNGLNVKELPEWLRGSIVIDKIDDDKILNLLNTRALNPLSSAKEAPGLAPQIQIALERMTGRRFPTGTPFTSADEVERHGVIVKRRGKGDYERISHPTPPPLSAHILRTLPQINMLEALLYPYRKHSGGGLFGADIMTKRGRPIPLQETMKIAQILGLPVAETNLRDLRKNRTTVRQAGQSIERNLRRSSRAAERVYLGEE